jgi:hypothetical protein
VRAVDLTAKGRQEESVRSGNGSVAQGIERPPPKRQVDGSNPSGVTSLIDFTHKFPTFREVCEMVYKGVFFTPSTHAFFIAESVDFDAA